MLLQALACEILIDAILDAAFLEIAVEGARVADRYHRGARTRAELVGRPETLGWPRTELSTVRIRIERWLVEAIEEMVESQKPSRVRAFVHEAVLAHLERTPPASARGRSPPNE